MTSENNSPGMQERQDDSNAPETADRERIGRLANESVKSGLRKGNTVTTRGTTSLRSNGNSG
jgi:hypothetical protein